MKFSSLFILLFLLWGSCTPAPQGKRSIASTQNLDEDDIKRLRQTIEQVLSTYTRQPYEITEEVGAKDIAFNISVTAADRNNLLGPAGIRVTSLKDTINQMAIAIQQKKKEEQKEKFRWEERSLVFMTFLIPDFSKEDIK